MSRWYVNRARLSALGEYRWITETDDGDWHEFETWREAQDFADKQARTITVTLPRKPGMVRIGKGKHTLVTRTKNDGTALYFMDNWGDDKVVFMKTKYLEPLALALLAAANHAEKEKNR